MVIRPLTTADFDAVHSAFVSAFSDYVVPFSLTREQLDEMLTRRGWVPEASVGAFDGDAMVAFTLNGVEGSRGYDSGTGVVPTHRRHGLARDLMRASERLLRDRGCSEYVLEVLEPNERAAKLYLSEGFVISRGLQCWRFDLSGPQVAMSSAVAHPEWWDVIPSWQNSTRSVARAKDDHVTIGDEDGYAIVFSNTGDVPQLAVRREARRRGIGTRLLRAAASVAGKPLRILNVDDRDAGIAAFLEAAGATKFVRQFEMIKAL